MIRALPGRIYRIIRRYRPSGASTVLFPGSIDYWERRYANGGNSGVGSYSFFADFSDTDDNRGYVGTHVRHRKFTEWVQAKRPDFELFGRVPNRYPYRGDYRRGSFADFYFYRRERQEVSGSKTVG